MLYFDWMSRTRFGSFRDGLWAFIHFPFYLSLVLLMGGAAQFILWRKVVEVVWQVRPFLVVSSNPSNIYCGAINKQFMAAEAIFTGTSSVALSQLFSNVTNDVFMMFNPKFTHTIDEARKSIYAIGNSTFQFSRSTAPDQHSFCSDPGLNIQRFWHRTPRGANECKSGSQRRVEQKYGSFYACCMSFSTFLPIPETLCQAYIDLPLTKKHSSSISSSQQE
jgi:hypothetical protein